MAPAMVVLLLGIDPTGALVWSQVVLCFGVPFALIPLIWLTRRRDVMGAHTNSPAVTATATAMAALIISLNLLLVFHTFAG
jgi:manganese transport protein